MCAHVRYTVYVQCRCVCVCMFLSGAGVAVCNLCNYLHFASQSATANVDAGMAPLEILQNVCLFQYRKNE